jgi:rhodanese-related sulfurtransferase
MVSLNIAQTRVNENITCEQAMELIQKHVQDTNFIVLDVRTPEEFKNGHIERAIIIDYKSSDFQDKLSKLVKKKTYLVYCKAGGRSAGAIGMMKDLNFTNLYHLYEGFEIWKTDGYKTVTD